MGGSGTDSGTDSGSIWSGLFGESGIWNPASPDLGFLLSSCFCFLFFDLIGPVEDGPGKSLDDSCGLCAKSSPPVGFIIAVNEVEVESVLEFKGSSRSSS